jgi:hypothetical protein
MHSRGLTPNRLFGRLRIDAGLDMVFGAKLRPHDECKYSIRRSGSFPDRQQIRFRFRATMTGPNPQWASPITGCLADARDGRLADHLLTEALLRGGLDVTDRQAPQKAADDQRLQRVRARDTLAEHLAAPRMDARRRRIRVARQQVAANTFGRSSGICKPSRRGRGPSHLVELKSAEAVRENCWLARLLFVNREIASGETMHETAAATASSG